MTILYCNQLLYFQFFNGEYFEGWLRNRYKLHAGLKVDFEVFFLYFVDISRNKDMLCYFLASCVICVISVHHRVFCFIFVVYRVLFFCVLYFEFCFIFCALLCVLCLNFKLCERIFLLGLLVMLLTSCPAQIHLSMSPI